MDAFEKDCAKVMLRGKWQLYDLVCVVLFWALPDWGEMNPPAHITILGSATQLKGLESALAFFLESQYIWSGRDLSKPSNPTPPR